LVIHKVQQIPKPTNIPAKNFTPPLIYVGNTGKEGGSISKDVSFLTAKAPNNSVEWKILSYTVTFASNGKEDVPITVTGTQFLEKVKTRIQSASSGTIIDISNVLILSIAGKCTIVRPIVIRIRKINRIEIVDLSDKVIYQFNHLRNQINLSVLSQGIYFLKLKDCRFSSNKRF